MPERANLDPRNTPLTTEACEGHVTITDPTHPLFGRTLTLAGLATLPSRIRHCQVALESGQVVYVTVMVVVLQGMIGPPFRGPSSPKAPPMSLHYLLPMSLHPTHTAFWLVRTAGGARVTRKGYETRGQGRLAVFVQYHPTETGITITDPGSAGALAWVVRAMRLLLLARHDDAAILNDDLGVGSLSFRH